VILFHNRGLSEILTNATGYRLKINVNDKKSSKLVMSRYTGGSAVAAGGRMEGMLYERIDARVGGVGVVGDE